MAAADFFNLFLQNVAQTTLIEIIAVVFGLLSVWYSMKVNILVYPTGIVSVLIYVYICFFAGLYADMGINFVYFVMSIYGWYNWSRSGIDKPKLAVSFSTTKELTIGIVATMIAFIALSYVLFNFTDSTVPFIDSFTTAVFIVGMWLMAVKKVENWIYWIIGDIVSVPLYFYKGLVFTSFQYLVFLIIAVVGYYAWRKEARLA
ncbi:MAG: nicotinamide riboside transporter PnuC [Ignavibacteria bacterium]|nr:nicotinamide riboside transporter PnuC [Ignavibacteria bacterium]